jgi:hypothetical protein
MLKKHKFLATFQLILHCDNYGIKPAIYKIMHSLLNYCLVYSLNLNEIFDDR